MPNIIIAEKKVRIDKDTGYLCITDIANLQPGGKENIRSWMRLRSSVEFFMTWERRYNPGFNETEFTLLRNESGSNTFHLSASDLISIGAVGIIVKLGRYGGTYCAFQWAIHFANWLDADYYLQTIDRYLSYARIYHGEHAIKKRFARELAAEDYKLITQNKLAALPPEADVLVERHTAAVEADIINLAMWGMTAQEWRIRFPHQLTGEKKNMRDYATTEELKALSALQNLCEEMQQTGYSSEERLDRLRTKAQERLRHYCSTDQKVDVLTLAQHKRGWGLFDD